MFLMIVLFACPNIPPSQSRDKYRHDFYSTFLFRAFFSARIICGSLLLFLFSTTPLFAVSTGESKVCPAQTPSKNIQRKRQKTITPIPPTPLLVSSNLSFLTFGLRLVAMKAAAYIRVGAVRPTISRPFFSTT